MMHKVNKTYIYDQLFGDWITGKDVTLQHDCVAMRELWGDILVSIKSYPR